MPNSNVQGPSQTVSNAKLERKLRLSLPEKGKSTNTVAAAGSRRNTISDDSLPKVRKKSKAPLTPVIPEDENETVDRDPEFVVINETKNSIEFSRTASNMSKKSALSSQSAKSSFAYDNGAFEGKLKTTSELRPGSRTPSLRSLEVYHEQYCCCSKRTKCERYLLVTVTILSIIVIALIIVIAVLAKNGTFDGYKMFKLKL